mmetsp:Transcript_107769/g.343432  ORF Transcript_107769/g.343432 Transcript_107769/m.343432 type:complete len:242 (+) Transcript_107769:310-1035(+)
MPTCRRGPGRSSPARARLGSWAPPCKRVCRRGWPTSSPPRVPRASSAGLYGPSSRTASSAAMSTCRKGRRRSSPARPSPTSSGVPWRPSCRGGRRPPSWPRPRGASSAASWRRSAGRSRRTVHSSAGWPTSGAGWPTSWSRRAHRVGSALLSRPSSRSVFSAATTMCGRGRPHFSPTGQSRASSAVPWRSRSGGGWWAASWMPPPPESSGRCWAPCALAAAAAAAVAAAASSTCGPGRRIL